MNRLSIPGQRRRRAPAVGGVHRSAARGRRSARPRSLPGEHPVEQLALCPRAGPGRRRRSSPRSPHRSTGRPAAAIPARRRTPVLARSTPGIVGARLADLGVQARGRGTPSGTSGRHRSSSEYTFRPHRPSVPSPTPTSCPHPPASSRRSTSVTGDPAGTPAATSARSRRPDRRDVAGVLAEVDLEHRTPVVGRSTPPRAAEPAAGGTGGDPSAEHPTAPEAPPRRPTEQCGGPADRGERRTPAAPPVATAGLRRRWSAGPWGRRGGELHRLPTREAGQLGARPWCGAARLSAVRARKMAPAQPGSASIAAPTQSTTASQRSSRESGPGAEPEPEVCRGARPRGRPPAPTASQPTEGDTHAGRWRW